MSYSKPSAWKIFPRNVYYIHTPSEYLLYSKPSPRILYYIANIPPFIADHPPDILLYSKCSPLIRITTIDSEFSTLIVLILIVIYH